MAHKRNITGCWRHLLQPCLNKKIVTKGQGLAMQKRRHVISSEEKEKGRLGFFKGGLIYPYLPWLMSFLLLPTFLIQSVHLHKSSRQADAWEQAFCAVTALAKTQPRFMERIHISGRSFLLLLFFFSFPVLLCFR